MLKAETDHIRDRISQSATVRSPEKSGARSIFLNSVFGILFLSMILLYAYGAWHFFLDPEVSPSLRGIFTMGGGAVVLLFFYALLSRLRTMANDPYSHIDR